MPREIAHGFVALKALEQTSEFGGDILNNTKLKSMFLLGTCTPDSGYYCQSPFIKGEHVSDILHNSSSNDSYSLIKEILGNTTDKSLPPLQLQAFCLGYMSHLLVDSYFHPYIFSITGNYYHPDRHERTLARARHRKLEMLLDIALMQTENLSQETFNITSYLTEIIEDLTVLDFIMTKKMGLKKNTIRKSWWWHSQFQRIFTNPLLSNRSATLPISIEFKALFNNYNQIKIDHVRNSIETYFGERFESIISNSIKSLAGTFNMFIKDPRTFLNATIGPSPNSGKIGILHYDGNYEIDKDIL